MPKLEEQPHQTATDRHRSSFEQLDPHGISELARTVSFPASDTRALTEDIHLSEEWSLACRVAASRGLSRSGLLPKFLLYICEQTLTGNERLLTEQRIGTAIFNRPADYNPGEDNIVRSYARTLRRRLDEYFEQEAAAESLRITIPRGGYIPVFEKTHSEDLLPNKTREEPAPCGPPVLTEPTTIRSSSNNHAVAIEMNRRWWPTVGGFLLGILVAVACWLAWSMSREQRNQPPSHQLWAELVQQNRNTLIVPADSGFGIVQNLSGHIIPLEEYANGSYFSDNREVSGIGVANLADLRQQRYTSLVDLNITARLLQLPELTAGRAEIRYARNLSTEDLKLSDVILLGSSHSNPWVSLFQDRLNFQLRYLPEVNQSLVTNEHPDPHEQKEYLNGTGHDGNQTYGVVDYLPNLEGDGHVLIIQGLNMAATQAAADVLFNQEVMHPILKRATRANGSLRPFELLVQTSSIGATNPSSQIIAARFYP